jgi:hypothetical protein
MGRNGMAHHHHRHGTLQWVTILMMILMVSMSCYAHDVQPSSSSNDVVYVVDTFAIVWQTNESRLSIYNNKRMVWSSTNSFIGANVVNQSVDQYGGVFHFEESFRSSCSDLTIVTIPTRNDTVLTFTGSLCSSTIVI